MRVDQTLYRGRPAEKRIEKEERCYALLDKPSRRQVNFNPDCVGKEVPDVFVVGFGLDYDEKYRNLPYVGILKPEVYEKQ